MIILTNDDGLSAEGIAALFGELRTLGCGDILVAVPETQHSAMSHAMTLDRPLVARRSVLPKFGAGDASSRTAVWVVCGTPADCVKLACTTLARPNQPQFLISGINHGSNVGTGILYSGTVAAALEGAINRVPSVAISLSDGDRISFSEAARVISPVLVDALQHKLPPWTILNINVPNLSAEQIRGFRVVPMGRSRWVERYQELDHREDGTQVFRLTGSFVIEGHDDAWALAQGWITVSMLGLTLSSVDGSEFLNGWTSLRRGGSSSSKVAIGRA